MEPIYNITSTNNNKRKQSGLSRDVVHWGTATKPSSATALAGSASTSSTGLFNPFKLKRQRLNPKRQEIECLAGEASRIEILTGLTGRDRQEIEESAPDGLSTEGESQWVDLPLGFEVPGELSDDDSTPIILSDAGQTYMTVTNAMYGPTYSVRVKRRQITRRERIIREARAWEVQIERLADAYLIWKASSSNKRHDIGIPFQDSGRRSAQTNTPATADLTNSLPANTSQPPPPPPNSAHSQSPQPSSALPTCPPAVTQPTLRPPAIDRLPSPITPNLNPSNHDLRPHPHPLSIHSESTSAHTSTTSLHLDALSDSSDHRPPSPLPPLATSPMPHPAQAGVPLVVEVAQDALQPPSSFQVEAVSWHWRDPCFPVSQNYEEPAKVSLIREGLLSSSPLLPSFAISLRSLESYRRLRLRSPRLSVQSFAKSLCDTYKQPYRPSLRQNISDAYDAYLLILRHVDTRIKATLKFDTPDWRLRNACPPCHYVLKDEPPLKFESLIALDGNMSLKRFADAGAADTLTFDSDYFLSRDEVDKFKDEVKKKKKTTTKTKAKPNAAKGTDKDEVAKGLEKGKGKAKEATVEKRDVPKDGAGKIAEERSTAAGDDDGDTADVALELDNEAPEEHLVKGAIPDPLDELKDVLSVCVERWKANAPDHKKGMFECFDESGVFVSICRHGSILVVCDMVRSGELSKYPLAILAKLQEVFPGVKGVGYDIGCDFEKTSRKSSIGETLRAHFVVPSMHGYAHNRPCQLKHHPKYTFGAGLEDFEGCERVFSSSNDCARTTRHATTFHRHQAIHQHFRQWDEDKYASLGLFIRNNYRQALTNIEEASDLFNNPHHADHIEKDHYNKWLAKEGAYLEGLKKEPIEDTLALAYVKALKALDTAEAEFEPVRKSGVAVPSGSRSDSDPGKRTLKKTYKASMEQVSFHMVIVSDLESQMGLHERWTSDSLKYKEAELYLLQRSYHLALDTLEARVAARLFELEKAHVPETGYKLRTHILKHLKSQSDAIRTALNAYNLAASRLNPPKPKIKFDDVLNLSFLAEFDLLRDTRQDIRSKPWANPSMRMVINKYSTFLQSEEEIKRLNIEIRRLRTWIRDVEAHYASKVALLTRVDPPLAAELADRALRQKRVHSVILKHLDEVEGWEEFTGVSGCGTRAGGTTMSSEQGGVQARDHEPEDDEAGSESESELVEGQIDGLDDALTRMEAS